MSRNISKTSIEDYLRQKQLDELISKHISGKVQNNKEEANKNSVPKKYDKVNVQLQILYFLGVLDELKDKGTLEQKGIFFGALLNRHTQRARAPFSSINNLIYSSNKQEANKIKKNLEIVRELFDMMKMNKEIKKVEQAIYKINQKHFPETL